MRDLGFDINDTYPTVKCKVFEGNSGALEIAKTHKFWPCTKHLNIKLHHFRDYVNRRVISIEHIKTDEQYADILTKPVKSRLIEKHQNIIMDSN